MFADLHYNAWFYIFVTHLFILPCNVRVPYTDFNKSQVTFQAVPGNINLALSFFKLANIGIILGSLMSGNEAHIWQYLGLAVQESMKPTHRHK